jgi:hypothetical protein
MARPGLDITLKIKETFFDRPAIVDRVRKARRKNLSKAGAFVRKRARSSLRRRKKTSAAGQTPSVHSKNNVATLKNILFGYDAATDGAIVGPVGLRASGGIGPPRAPGDVPEALESGGTLRVRERLVAGKWLPAKGRSRLKTTQERTRLATYQPRPFMGPALAAEHDAVAAIWKDSV